MRSNAVRVLIYLSSWLSLWVALLPRPSDAQPGVTLRVPAGFEMVVPAGWSWGSLSEDAARIIFPRPAGAPSGLTKEIRLHFTHRMSRQLANPNLAKLRERRTLPNGTEVLWEVKRGPYPDWWELRALLPRATDGGRIEVFSNYFSPAERASVERAFWESAQSIRLLPSTHAIAHPVSGFSVEIPQGDGAKGLLWRTWVEPAKEWVRLMGNLSEGVGPPEARKYRDVWFASLYVYPAWLSITTLDMALADIREYFTRAGNSYGPPQREEFPGGSALWVNAPGAKSPFIGAAFRDGKIFFVSCERTTPAPSPGKELPGEAEIRDGFHNALRSVRPAH